MSSDPTRRDFVKATAMGAVAVGLGGKTPAHPRRPKRDFKISIAAWSVHREVRSGKLKLIDACRFLREEYDVDGFELVNTLLEVPTAEYVRKFRAEAQRFHLAIPLIMCDGEGDFGSVDPDERRRAVRYHTKWMYVASDLGCHSIRVNWRGAPEGAEKDPALVLAFTERSIDAYAEMARIGGENGLNVIIENPGGISSPPEMLLGLIKAVNSPRFGTLPDWGGFPDDVDRYDAVDKMMPYAKGVSAKCYDFGPDGRETKIDFERMVQICVDKHGYHSFLGIEFEGDRLTERQGMRAAKDLLVKLRG